MALRFLRAAATLLNHRVARALGVAAVCAVGVAIFAVSVDFAYPVKTWLAWRLLVLWGWCALFHGACLTFGHLCAARWLGVRDRPVLETLVVSAGAGMVAFTMAMYVLGALALYRTGVAVALPIAMILAGGPDFLRFARQRWAEREARAPSLSGLAAWAAVAFGVLGFALLYLQSLTPDAINYDAKWYHLAIAADYAREGRIVPFPADYNKAFPHLASIVYAWGWLLPGLNDSLRCMLALHNEIGVILWSMAGVGACADWLVGGRGGGDRVRGAWAAYLLFPIIFVYDSNPGGGADHFVGFFAAPLFLATARAVEDLSPRRCALAGALAAGALLTKYQAIYLLVPAALAIVGCYLGRWVWLMVAARVSASAGGVRGAARLWRGPAAALLAGALVSAPHFLKNWIFYRNPMYPFMISTFSGSRPRVPDSPMLVRYLLTGDSTIPRGPLLEQLRGALTLAFTFSFRQSMSGKQVPQLGSLFTLLLPALVFLRGARRLWLGALAALIALVIWGMTYPVDRYLQAVVPILAAVTVAIIVRAWELGLVARAGVIALVGLQIVWGADIPFQAAWARISDGVSMIRGGMEGGAATRFAHYLRSQNAISRRVPRDAVVLFHNSRLSLGVNRKVLQDLPGFQGLIDVRGARTVRDLVALYRSFGITHVVHERGAWPSFSKQEEVLFATLLARHATDTFQEGEYEVFALPAQLPPVEAPMRVLSLGWDGYEDGVYPVAAMSVLEPVPPELRHWPAPELPVTVEAAASPDVMDQVDAVLVGSKQVLPAPVQAAVNAKMTLVISYGGRFNVYVRKEPRAPGN